MRGLPFRVLRIYLFLVQVDWELRCFTLLLRECGKVRDHTALKCQLSRSLKFSIWIPVYNPYTGCINRTHIIPSKLSRRSDKGKSIQVYCPGLLSFTCFHLQIPGVKNNEPTIYTFPLGVKSPYLTTYKPNEATLNRNGFTHNMENYLK